MKEEWHDINAPGFFKIATSQQITTPVECLTNTCMKNEETTEEVKLSDPIFLEGDGGFDFNNKCRVRVKVEYLKETFRKKVTFSLFSDYKGEVQDMHHTVDGYEENGVAEAQITLYYNNAHYPDYFKDHSIPVSYFFKATHPRGKEVESPTLIMPNMNGSPMLKIELEINPNLGSTLDDKYTLYSNDKIYCKTLTVKDDKIDGDDIITLEFKDIKPDLRYTLEIDIGTEGDKYIVFEDIPYIELRT